LTGINRATFNSDIQAAAAVQQAANISADATLGVALTANGVDQGYNVNSSSTAANQTYQTAVMKAAKVQADSKFAAEQAKQATLDAARDQLRLSGDNGAL
jgi:hypothetical protein